jgi:transglutaminase-like putative cysteine protease
MLSAAALAFGRVFQGGGASLRLVIAAVASAALATTLERRNLLVATIASAALLVVAIGLLVFPQTTAWGLPSGRTFAAVGRAIGLVRQQARIRVSPTEPVPPLFLAAVTAIWAAAFSAHALLARAGGPILAMLPPVALVGFADTVLDDGGRPFFALLFLIGVLAVVLADGVRRMRQWGPIWPWHGRDGRRRAMPVRGATRVAAIAIGAAALLPGLLPGFGAGPLIDLGSSSDNGRINPFVSIGATLRNKTAENLFTVRSPVKTYWRILSDDTFDPETSTWYSADPSASRGVLVASASRLPGAAPGPSTTAGPPGDRPVTQTFTILKTTPVGHTWLPMAYAPQSIDYPAGSIRYDPALSTAFVPGSLSAETQYSVISRINAPTRAQLEAVTSLPAASRYVDLKLEGDTATELKRIAQQITFGATTPFDQVVAIQDHFLAPPFRYSLNVDYRQDANGIVDFLTKSHVGFCQQYATSMALLVRELGYPARVAVGYRPGTEDPENPGLYTVTSQQLHSWVEVLFPPYGWIAFEPTPNRTNPVAAASYLAPPPSASCSGKGCSSTGQASAPGKGHVKSDLPAGARNPNGLGSRQSRGKTLQRQGRSGSSVAPPADRIPYRVLVRIAIVLGLAFLVLAPPIRVFARRARVRRAHTGRSRILAEYNAFTDRAADLGFPRAPGETIDEFRRRVMTRVTLSNGHLGRLSSAAERAAYGVEEPPPEGAHALRSDARVALKDVRRSVGIAQRLRGLYRPSL